jgi:quinol monooxygenase YgiN
VLYAMNVRLRVEDYARWKEAFDGAKTIAARKAGGETSYQVFRTVEDPNTLVLLFTWDSLEKLQQYAQSPTLRELMQQSGVIDPGESLTLEKLDEGSW